MNPHLIGSGNHALVGILQINHISIALLLRKQMSDHGHAVRNIVSARNYM